MDQANRDDAGGQGNPIVRVGEVILGKFRVEKILGEGGMGVVVAAKHLQLDEIVALKFMRPHALRDPETVARFAQEARAAAKLKSEHVARVLDVGVRDDGAPFIVMEYLQGRDLAQMLMAGGTMPVERAAELIIQACEGLAEAHARGIIHRDIKPANLFVVEGRGWQSLKILDFGISKAALGGDEPTGINTRSIMGSPCYMSPEQLRSTQSVDHRADIWSLGAVLYELLTSSTAFDYTRPITELIATILEQQAPSVRRLRPELPHELEAIVQRCLERDRALRFQNAAELAIALVPFAPKRSRVTAERAVHFTSAAGLSSGSLELPPSLAPPPPGSKPRVAENAETALAIQIPKAGMRPLIDQVTSGKYQPIASLGKGGMAEVFLAVARGPLGFNKLIVMKRLRKVDDPTFRDMFLDEARLAARLNHPNVVQPYEVGEDAGGYFIAMEYLEGQPLNVIVRETFRAGKRLDLLMSARIVADALAGLHYAHELRDYDGTPLAIVHRDVSPHNVIVTYEGQAKLVDFGIAKAALHSTSTEVGILKGKVGYMSPEQALGEGLDRRADVFAMGIVLWELLTFKRLMGTDSAPAIIHRLMNSTFPSARQVDPSIPPELDAIAMRALQKDPAARYQTAREMRDALLSYVATHPNAPREEAIGEHVQHMFAATRERVRQQVQACMQAASKGSLDEISPLSLELVGAESPASRFDPNARVATGSSRLGARVSTGSSSRSGSGSSSGQIPVTVEGSDPTVVHATGSGSMAAIVGRSKPPLGVEPGGEVSASTGRVGRGRVAVWLGIAAAMALAIGATALTVRGRSVVSGAPEVTPSATPDAAPTLVASVGVRASPSGAESSPTGAPDAGLSQSSPSASASKRPPTVRPRPPRGASSSDLDIRMER